MNVLDIRQVALDDAYWNSYLDLVRQTVIPYQWEALNDRIPDAEPSYCIRNFRIAAGLEQGEFGGMVFQDSDLAKWLEAVGYVLAAKPDPELEKLADGAIDLIVLAQQEDGYLNTYFTIKEPGKRWTNLHECHELYCAGHMMEAAVAYYEGTGKRKLLDAMCRFADHIDAVFGPADGQIHGYCGHQEIELALVKLYRATGVERYLRLSSYFIDQRGAEPSFFIEEWEKRGRINHWGAGEPHLPYNQSHLPVREQQVAVGHSVRAVYMYTAMADLARLTGDAGLLEACRRLWSNMTHKQMYITGGIGSTHHGEAFSFDYDLPNDTVYAETCASVGLIFFAERMLRIEADSRYADVLERALYNTVIGSMSLDGKHYFYVNPLEVWPEACVGNPGKHHVKPVRQKWFGCSCCPPNVARLLGSLQQYIYTMNDSSDTLYVHLYIGSEAAIPLAAGQGTLRLRQTTGMPWNGRTTFEVLSGSPAPFTLALRIPDWAAGRPELRVNGEPLGYQEAAGYAMVQRVWSDGDTLEWLLPMEAQWMQAHPHIRADAGKAALQRGPLVYCFEQADNGGPIASLAVDPASEWSAHFDAELLGGIVVLEGGGFADGQDGWSEAPYRKADSRKHAIRLKAIPYPVWGNRGAGEMSVWMRMN